MIDLMIEFVARIGRLVEPFTAPVERFRKTTLIIDAVIAVSGLALLWATAYGPWIYALISGVIGYIFIAASVSLYIVYLYATADRPPLHRTLRWIERIPPYSPAVAALLTINNILIPVAQRVFSAARAYNATLTTIAITAIVAASAYGLFRLKVRNLSLYASAEIAFGLISCFVAVERVRTQIELPNATVVVGSAYLVVRGLDNRQKAFEVAQRGLRTASA